MRSKLDMVRKCLEPGLRSPFLFEVDTKTGKAFVAVVLRGAERRDVVRGFRHLSLVPQELIVNSYKREQRRAWLASGRNGSWFTGGMTRNMKIVGAPY